MRTKSHFSMFPNVATLKRLFQRHFQQRLLIHDLMNFLKEKPEDEFDSTYVLGFILKYEFSIWEN